MKNMKILGIIAMAAIIGFTLTACPEDNNGGSSLGEELNLSGQVYVVERNVDETTRAVSYTYTPFTGNLVINAAKAHDYYINVVALGGTGAVTAGQFSYIIGTPNPEALRDIYEWREDDGDVKTTYSDSTVKYVYLSFVNTPGGEFYRGKSSYSGIETYGTYTEEVVDYIYVDKDVTVSRAYETDTETYQYDGVPTYNRTKTSNSYSLKLKKGWNAIYWKATEVSSFNAATNTRTYTETYSMSTSNPSGLYWVYDEW